MSDLRFENEDERQIPRERSSMIEILCVLGFITALFVIPECFAGVMRQGASFSSLVDAFFSLVFTFCLVGFWKMRRWAVFIYAGAWVIYEIILIVTGHWSALTVPIPVLLIAAGFRNLWRMT
jgi:hypothetical protein